MPVDHGLGILFYVKCSLCIDSGSIFPDSYVHQPVQMLERLSGFEGTCLTLLVRGFAPPVSDIQEAFSRVPSERFSVTHVPLYNPSFGHVADGLMLSWAVRNAGATAFVSTLYTQPFQVNAILPTTYTFPQPMRIPPCLPRLIAFYFC